jgi:hypothetical protein
MAQQGTYRHACSKRNGAKVLPELRLETEAFLFHQLHDQYGHECFCDASNAKQRLVGEWGATLVGFSGHERLGRVCFAHQQYGPTRPAVGEPSNEFGKILRRCLNLRIMRASGEQERSDCQP